MDLPVILGSGLGVILLHHRFANYSGEVILDRNDCENVEIEMHLVFVVICVSINRRQRTVLKSLEFVLED